MLTLLLILVDLCKEQQEDFEMRFRQIEKRFHRMKDKNPKKAAELAYVIAMNAKHNKNDSKAIEFGRECLRLLAIINPQTKEECATIFTGMNGVALPEFLHQDVVKDRLSPLVL
jgi:hypothetical protein